MRISSKGRYALASVISMGRNYNSGEYTTVISISEKFGISKIYLEQVFSLLKRGGILSSVKGAQGGYLLTRPPSQITAFDVLSAVESALFEPAEETAAKKAPDIEAAMRESVFSALDSAVERALKSVTVETLINEAQKHSPDSDFMFYI